MIQQQTILRISDNSGAKTAKCIKVLGGFRKKEAGLGDTVVVAVQELRDILKDRSKVQKKEVHRALIIRTKKKLKTKSGFELSLKENSIVLINKQNNPIGTRILGPIPRYLKKKKLKKLTNIARKLI